MIEYIVIAALTVALMRVVRIGLRLRDRLESAERRCSFWQKRAALSQCTCTPAWLEQDGCGCPEGARYRLGCQ